ncbi:MAG: relaxase/mobilization nuclease domain-containing protein [Rhodobacteraceae bacterium]|nr:relaxase/mobilization nuclease domain-containing protein [Paracoccaceae bacterium]
MILKGSQRAGAANLSDHLMNERDNDHITLLELRGFISDNLGGALSEAYAISKATRCKQFMFSLSLNPPKDHVASEQDFLDAADRAEKALGLDAQPRAIIIHEKEGRRHAHVVWSRIDGENLKAINLPHFKRKLNALSRDLYLDHGWELPKGLQAGGGKSPLNFTLAEWQQAKRKGLDPREIKQVFQDAWKRSDNLKAFGNALAERGYFIAKGDRRGFVALDVQGKVYSIPKWTGIRAKEANDKFGSPQNLPSVSHVQGDLRGLVTDKLKDFIADIKSKHTRDTEPLNHEKIEMVALHRAERLRLNNGQLERQIKETKTRSDRLNKGVRGLFDWVSGKAKSTKKRNESEAYQCFSRDRDQRDDLVKDQMTDRQSLQKRFDAIRKTQIQDRRLLARDVSQFLRASERRSKTDAIRPRERKRGRGPDLTP